MQITLRYFSIFCLHYYLSEDTVTHNTSEFQYTVNVVMLSTVSARNEESIDVMYRMVQCFAVMVQPIRFCDRDIFLNGLQLTNVFEASDVARTVFNHDTAADQAYAFF